MSKCIRCKFKVDHIVQTKFNEVYTQTQACMSPVFSDEEGSENKAYWDATPTGKLEFTVTNNSLNHLVPGKEYYLDISPVGE